MRRPCPPPRLAGRSISRIAPALVPVTLLLWLSLSASHWRGSLGQQLEQHLGQQLGELYRFTDKPGDSPRRRLERFQSDETPILQSLPTSAIRAVKSAGSSSDRSRGGATKEDGASAAAAGFPSSPFPRVFESGQGSCGFPDTRADADECVADLAEFPALSARSGSATVRKLACLAHNYLRPWMGIPGVTAGMGARGMISAEILHQMGTMANVSTLFTIDSSSVFRAAHDRVPRTSPPLPLSPTPQSPLPPHPFPHSYFFFTVPYCSLQIRPRPYRAPATSPPFPSFSSFPVLPSLGPDQILSCSGHIRIVRGKVFFRLGAFQFDWYRMRRFVFTVKMIQDAISAYKLYNLNAELFINTCDLPTSKADSVARADRAGMPLFSPHVVPGSLDIPYPDPVDLSKSYFRDVEDKVSWEQKQGRAVFRGGMTNYHIAMPMHWRSSPRFRVHRMADARPDLLDARVMSGVDVRWRKSMEEDGVRLGGRLKPEELQGFKYELDVDGGTGSGRTCGILASNQHFLPTHRYFNNLYAQIQWARANDQRAREIVAAANEFASTFCTWEGRRLFWAILLAKYSTSALEDSASITAPPLHPCSSPPTQADVEKPSKATWHLRQKMPAVWPPWCGKKDEVPNQPECTYYCIG
ncbi:unnamed protein product, partial [Closterium sp. NIES-53]